VPVAPAAARVLVGSTRVSHHGRTGTPGIPARDGFNGFLRALLGDRAFLPPSLPRSVLLENLTPALRRQDHTTSPSARWRSRQQRNSRPSHPNPTSVTIAKRPFVWAGMTTDMQVICLKSEPEYFCEGGWTCDALICPSGRKLSAARSPASTSNSQPAAQAPGRKK
jgi:hypothetical protein